MLAVTRLPTVTRLREKNKNFKIMARKEKFVVGEIYHIYNRGVNKANIFLNDNDRWRFLQGMYLLNDEKNIDDLRKKVYSETGLVNFKTLRDFFKKENRERKPIVRILADCLMTNHFHLLIQEIVGGGISRFMHKLLLSYSRYFNQKHNRTGPLFSGRFKSIRIDKQNYLEYVIAYINVVNPLEVYLKEQEKVGKRKDDIKKPEALKFLKDFYWNTHLEYLGERDSDLIDVKAGLGYLGGGSGTHEDYKKLVDAVLELKGVWDERLKSVSDLFLEDL